MKKKTKVLVALGTVLGLLAIPNAALADTTNSYIAQWQTGHNGPTFSHTTSSTSISFTFTGSQFCGWNKGGEGYGTRQLIGDNTMYLVRESNGATTAHNFGCGQTVNWGTQPTGNYHWRLVRFDGSTVSDDNRFLDIRPVSYTY